MKTLGKFLYKISKRFRFIPFVLLGICFLEIFFYDSNPFGLYKLIISGVKEVTGFGFLSNLILLYYFVILKHCWHSIIAVIGLMLLNLINTITMLTINILVFINNLDKAQRSLLIQSYDSKATTFDYAIIIITFIMAAVLLIRKEIFSLDEKHPTSHTR